MDPRGKEPKEAPEYVEWPGHGRATRLQPRGMSDYERGAGCFGHANYVTENNHCLFFRSGVRWQAQFRGTTTKWFATPEEAIANLEKRMNDE